MPPRKDKLQLGNSWVVEGDDRPEYSPSRSVETPPPQRTTPPHRTTRGARSPDPDFLMPPLDPDTMGASWAESASGSGTQQKGGHLLERESRRRNMHEAEINGSPQKRANFRASTDSHISTPTRHVPREQSQPEEVIKAVVDRGGKMVGHLLDIFGGALRILKTPLSYILAIYLLFGLGVVLKNLATTSVYASLSPICRIPGASLLNLPFCSAYQANSSHGSPPLVDYDELMAVQAKLVEVLEDSAGNTALPVEMQRAEGAIRDLRSLVRHSQLHSKNEFMLEFDGFVETSGIASYDLQIFNGHVGRAVDKVIATNRWTTMTLDHIRERDALRGAFEVFFNDKLLAPFQGSSHSPESALLDQYIQHTRLVEEQLFNLIDEAKRLLAVLSNLDDRLDVIHGLTIRDGRHTNIRKDEVLSQLWSILGGNKAKIMNIERDLFLLHHVGNYRKNAIAHLRGTISKLQAIGAGLVDLRERVADPDKTEIPLSVHIETVQLGVARLQEARDNSRKVVEAEYKKIQGRKNPEGFLIDAS